MCISYIRGICCSNIAHTYRGRPVAAQINQESASKVEYQAFRSEQTHQELHVNDHGTATSAPSRPCRKNAGLP